MAEYLNEKEAARHCRVSARTFVREVKPNVPTYRPSPGRVLYLASDIDEYILGTKKAPTKPAAIRAANPVGRKRRQALKLLTVDPAVRDMMRKLEVA